MSKKFKSNLREKIILKLTNNILIVTIWMIVVFISSTLTIVDGITFAKKTADQTFFHNETHYRMLNTVKVNTDISSFITIIGQPILKEKSESYVKYTFENHDFFLTALVDEQDRVVTFSVTSKKKSFKPSFELPGYEANGYLGKITLNETKFVDLYPKIEGPLSDSIQDESLKELAKHKFSHQTSPSCFLHIGVRRFRYFEGSYLGNPSNYQTIYYGINDSGYMDSYPMPENNDLWYILGTGECQLLDGNFRNSKVNTYVITAPFEFVENSISTDSANLLFGPDLDQVRVFSNN